MYKAGATYRDKNRIRKLVMSGMSEEHISQLTRIKPAHVHAIVAQVEAGTLHVSRGESRVGGGSYGEGEDNDAVSDAKIVKQVPPVKKPLKVPAAKAATSVADKLDPASKVNSKDAVKATD